MVSAQLSGAGTGLGQSRRDGEVLEEDHVALRLLRFRRLDRHQCGDAFAVRGKIVVTETYSPNIGQSSVGPNSRLIRYKRISLHGVRSDHNPIVAGSKEQVVPVARPGRIRASLVRNLPLAASIRKSPHI